MKKEEGGNFILAALITDSTKHLSNLLIHSSFSFYWYGRRAVFLGGETFQVIATQSLKLVHVSVPESPKISPGKCTGLFQVLCDPWGIPGVSCHSLDTGK